MKVSQVFQSKHLSAADVEDGDLEVVIASVGIEQFDDGNKLLVKFQNMDKGLVANKTNSNRIALLYGDDTDEWVGREIVLYQDMVDMQGKTTKAIRVRGPAKKRMEPQRMSATPMRQTPRRQDDGDPGYDPDTLGR
jgi:hypothetical protein